MNSINPLLRKVAEFHKAFNIESQIVPTIPNKEVIALRYKLALEELEEFKEAAEAGDLTEVFDALVDQLYILLGTVHAFGMGVALEEVLTFTASPVFPAGAEIVGDTLVLPSAPVAVLV